MQPFSDVVTPKAYAAAHLTPAQPTTITALFTHALSYIVLPVVSGVCVLAIIYSGILFLTSQGDPDKVKTARSSLTWAIVGIIIIVLSYAIVAWFSKTVTTKIL